MKNKLWENATLIAGPTASGKSALALQIAQQKDAVIFNADSMQIYDVLSVITARPSTQDTLLVPHLLYGHVDPASEYSTGHWIADVESALTKIETGRHVVFVGGTGLYFRALLGGLSPMPQIDEAVRQRWRYRLGEEGAPNLHRILRRMDPEAAMEFNPSDGQRIARALEVLETSGKSILWWQQQAGQPMVNPDTVERFVIEPDRTVLRQRIHDRFDRMVELGALDEVQLLMARNIPDTMPAMKAIGVQHLASSIAGQCSLEEAIELSKTATRQYAKRQMTWFRNQLTNNWKRCDPFRNR
ncbi:MAG: tRNA (adenosine(37)-N6)-dimethylallyltransferase MiaA [Ahrensia sp.]|nr:tRNA (adenosine(37)-N6)-dimethylallyltransferase MiaA [Ahrensia sp.]